MTQVLISQAIALAIVLLTAALAVWMKLGGDRRIRSEDEARQIARQLVCGFEPVAIALDRAGIGALLKDAAGRQLLVRRHGAHFTGRLLDARTNARLDQNFLTIQTGEAMFDAVTLDLGRQAAVWGAGFRHLSR